MNQIQLPKFYQIDFDKVKTVKDIKNILEMMDIKFPEQNITEFKYFVDVPSEQQMQCEQLLTQLRK